MNLDCPRCSGRMLVAQDGTAACFACGYELYDIAKAEAITRAEDASSTGRGRWRRREPSHSGLKL